jgi:glyoxylase-like metal-dependent hydrolase (beta-lactamase superfamily II)
MRLLVPGIAATEPQPLSFAPGLEVRSFLLLREQGNLLVYASSTLAGQAQAIEERGGASRHYLNHWHEASFGAGELDVPLHVHVDDATETMGRVRVDATFSKREVLGDDFELIPTPGHTPGATAFLWRHNGHRYLFTGDTLYVRDGEWAAAVLDSSDRDAYAASLELIRELDFDVLVPWAASRGEPPMSPTDPARTADRIDALLARELRPAARA